MALELWTEYLQAVDAVPQSEAVVIAAAKAFVSVSIPNPAAALGLSSDDVVTAIEEGSSKIAASALVRRCIRAIDQAAKVTEAQALAGAAVPFPLGQPALMPAQASSALALAGGIAPRQQEEVDVADLLAKADLAGLPSEGIAELSLYKELVTATKEAKAVGKTPFTYVDLTHRDLLPMWLVPEAVGGKTVLAGEEGDFEIDQDSSTGTVQQLSQALKKATAAPRFFRTLHQWLPCFLRYATVARCSSQLSFVAIMGHISTISKIVEDTKTQQLSSVHLALLYDEHRRRDWCRRAERKDTSLDIDAESWKVSEPLLQAVTTRLNATMSAAGLQGRSASSASNAPSSSTETILVARESALAKQAAAADAATRKSESARRALENAQNASKGGGKQGKNSRGGKDSWQNRERRRKHEGQERPPLERNQRFRR